MEDAVRCPYCSALSEKVVDSREGKEGEVVRRRRECLQCNRRFTTYERIEEIHFTVVKKDGRREPFDRAKLLAFNTDACATATPERLRRNAQAETITAVPGGGSGKPRK